MTQLEIEVKNRYGISRGDDTEETSGIDMQRASDFIDGYKQAEKDKELSWEDIKLLDKIFINEKIMSGLILGKKEYEEILKRFKEKKEKIDN